MDIIKDNLKIIILAVILVVLTIIFALINSCTNKNKYVKTLKTNGNSSLPYIKIKNDKSSEINKMLEEQYNEIINKNNKSYMSYKYSVSDNIFSLLVETGIKENNSEFIEVIYYTYNYDLQTKEFISKEELLKRNSITIKDVQNRIEKTLLNEYNKEVNEGYFDPNEYSFESFLHEKNYYSINDNLEIYMDNNKIYGYLNITNASGYYDKDNYPKVKKIYELK